MRAPSQRVFAFFVFMRLQTGARVLIKEVAHIRDAAGAFEGLVGDVMPFFLDSALTMERYGRYSIMGSNPVLAVCSKAGQTAVTRLGPDGRPQLKEMRWGDPLEAVAQVINKFDLLDGNACGEASRLPFTGGAVGYFGYDLNRQIENMPDIAHDEQQIPDIYLGFYTEALIIDHKINKTYAVSYIQNDSRPAIGEAEKRLQALIEKATGAGSNSSGQTKMRLPMSKSDSNRQRFEDEGIKGSVAANLTSNFTRREYRRMIEQAKHYIAEGDIFQVNLAQRFLVDLKTDHWALYKLLRKANPAPFGSFLGYGELSILSSSPERFMYVDGRYVETRPIKGTRPRYSDPHKDAISIKELLESEKDSAEHVMIVDVKRNDLGRVCKTGSVHVPELMVVESYKAVHHLVSTVVGELRPEVDMMDLLRASFPGGSISGAPKIRAMEIIEELEPHRRNLYTGSVGYISTNGKMDTNIVIRTITAIKDKGYLQVGGGIVADSDPDAEYQETLDKARALFNALGIEEDGLPSS